MTVLRSLAAVAALAALAQVGCASTSSAIPSGVASNPLVGSLTSGLGVSPDQAVGGTGAMVGLAQNKLTPDQFSALSNSVPGLGDITKAAGPLLGSVPLSSLGDVQSAFSKLGMSPEMVGKFAPILGDAISKGASPALGSAFSGLFK
jgi:hypothetical protein